MLKILCLLLVILQIGQEVTSEIQADVAQRLETTIQTMQQTMLNMNQTLSGKIEAVKNENDRLKFEIAELKMNNEEVANLTSQKMDLLKGMAAEALTLAEEVNSREQQYHLHNSEVSPVCTPRFYNVALTWIEAMGSDLLTIGTVEKLERVKLMMSELVSQGKVAAHCNGVNGYAYWTSAYGVNPTWSWGDGSDILPSLWVPGQPNGDGNCVLSNSQYNYDIHDGPCERRYCYICNQ